MIALAPGSFFTDVIAHAFYYGCLGIAAVLAALGLCEGIAATFGDFFVVRSWKREAPRVVLLGLLFLVPIAMPLASIVSAFVLYRLHRPDMCVREAMLLAVFIALSWLLLHIACVQVLRLFDHL